MEKGEIVYEGFAKDLLAQPELVQALSLGGSPEGHAAAETTLRTEGSTSV